MQVERTKLMIEACFMIQTLVSGGRVSNTWVTCPEVGDNIWKQVLIPHNNIYHMIFV